MNVTTVPSRTGNDLAAPADNLPAAPSPAAAEVGDWLTAAVVFAILGGCLALWLADLSLVTGAAAAMASGVFGVLFADW